MVKYVGYKRPKNTKKTLLHLMKYLGLHKWMFMLVALLVFVSQRGSKYYGNLFSEASDQQIYPPW